MQNFMGDFAGDPEFADYLMDMAADWWSAWYETMLKEVGEYVDIMWLGRRLGNTERSAGPAGAVRKASTAAYQESHRLHA